VEGRFNKWTERMLDGARDRGFLPEGEEVVEVMQGQTFFSPLLFFVLIGFVLWFFSRERAVVATDKGIYVIAINEDTGQAWRLEAEAPLADPQVTVSRSTVQVGDAKTVYTLQLKANRHIAELVEAAKRGTGLA
jgi:hypothetical protein